MYSVLTAELFTLVTPIMFLLICLQNRDFGGGVWRAGYLENVVVAVIFMGRHPVFIIRLPVFPY